MKSAQVTIKDIAKALGISPSTVSRALKDHPEISYKTKKAVNELAKKLNYEPNSIALSLRNSHSRSIGIIIPQIVHFFFSSVISGVEEVASKAGYTLIMCQSNESYETEVINIQTLLSKRVDGIMVSVSKTTSDFDHFELVKRSNIPIVFYDRACNISHTDRVIVDDYKGAYNIVSHLLEMGCHRIAHLATNQDLLIGKNRKNGYIQALKDHNIELDEDIILRCDTDEQAKLCVPYLLSLPKQIDGIFAVNDLTAITAMSIVKKAGFHVPDDIAIAGFSNGIYSSMTDPPLTTVEQHGFLVGKKAAELLLDRIHSDIDYDTRVEQVKTEIIIRESSQRKK